MELAWLFPYLDQYRHVGVTVGAFFFGEAFILGTSFLTFERGWPVREVFALAFLGTTLADLWWFLAGRSLLKRSRYLQQLKERRRELFEKFERQTRLGKVFSMIFFKFLYGTRIVTLLYLSAQRMAFWKFLAADILSTLLWLSVLFGIGWATRSGLSFVLHAFHGLGYVLTVIIVLILIVKLSEKWLRQRLRTKLGTE